MTFPRLADGSPVLQRRRAAGRVRYRVYDGTATSRLPHDLGHLIVERETGDHGGFWGAVAAGVVFSSMEHLDGRRPPHARERSEAAMRERSDGLRRAELMVWLTERVARDGVTAPQRVRAMAAEALSSFPEAQVDAEQVLAAARALRAAEERWAELSPGEELVVEWPDGRSRASERHGPVGPNPVGVPWAGVADAVGAPDGRRGSPHPPAMTAGCGAELARLGHAQLVRLRWSRRS